ncbi:MAG: hypothetical protein ACTHZ9_13495 [Leucobacter sp.]
MSNLQASPKSDEAADASSPFAAPKQARPEFGTILRFIISAILSFGGIYLMGAAFSVPGWGLVMFSAGLLAAAVGFGIAFSQRASDRPSRS